MQHTIVTQDLAAYLKAAMNIKAAANTAAAVDQLPSLQGARDVGLPTGLRVGGAMTMSLCNPPLLMTHGAVMGVAEHAVAVTTGHDRRVNSIAPQCAEARTRCTHAVTDLINPTAREAVVTQMRLRNL
jgi:hypothetical protein